MSKSQARVDSQVVEFRQTRKIMGLGVVVVPVKRAKTKVNITISASPDGPVQATRKLSPGDDFFFKTEKGEFRVEFNGRERGSALLSVVRLDGEANRVGQARRRVRRRTKRSRLEYAGALRSPGMLEFDDDIEMSSEE